MEKNDVNVVNRSLWWKFRSILIDMFGFYSLCFVASEILPSERMFVCVQQKQSPSCTVFLSHTRSFYIQAVYRASSQGRQPCLYLISPSFRYRINRCNFLKKYVSWREDLLTHRFLHNRKPCKYYIVFIFFTIKLLQ